ncbi:hypothetical protein [Sphingomonas flavalba]|uniref:hypothetical protein n=1 Tax=Sphingomonas flavalba TaxID=2559804 RepID=UPI00109E0019|nr:hypothetical protein [Sphingomonas flavalba]
MRSLLLFGPLLIAPVAAASAASSPLAGTYSADAMEMAAGLILGADGKFRYGLSYGALDEQAEGRWREKDGVVLLTTEPAVVPPRFVAVSDTVSGDGALYASLDEPDALGEFTLTLAVRYAGDPKVHYVEADEDGRVPVPTGQTVEAIVPDLPVYAAPYVPYAVKPGGRRIVFHFEANDVGKADFRDEPLAVEGSELVLTRHDRTIRFRRGVE